ncbi:MAG: motility protein A [bacterium]|nr:motility protein A [bacterium]
MDVATIIGILVAWGALALAAFIGHVDVSIIFARYEAFLLVFGGSIGATMISFPLKTLVQGIGALGLVFGAVHLEERETIATLVAFAEKARREGLLALENEANELQDEFMRKGIQLVIDGRDTDIIRKILETEVGYVEQRYKKAESVWTTMGGYSPTLGIIGTVLGLIAMLKSLATLGSDSSNVAGTIGIATAQAFVATFFGISLANLLWLPFAGKIRERSQQVLLLREIMIEGILAIQAGDNPRLLEEKLHAFLGPEEREVEVEPGGTVGELDAAPAG